MKRFYRQTYDVRIEEIIKNIKEDLFCQINIEDALNNRLYGKNIFQWYELLQKIEQSLNDYNSNIRELPFVPFQKIWLLIKDKIVMAEVRYITIYALDRIAIGLIISGFDTCQLEMNYDKNTMFETKFQAEAKLKELQSRKDVDKLLEKSYSIAKGEKI